MGTITFAIDKDAKSRLKWFSWVIWSRVARETFLNMLESDEILAKSSKGKAMTISEFNDWCDKL